MSQVISEFRTAAGIAATEPAHALLVAVTVVIGSVAGLVLGIIPILGPLVSAMVLTPAMLVITLGSAHAVRDGGDAFDGAREALSRAGTAVMGAYALLFAVYLVLSIALSMVFVLLAAGIGMGMGGPMDGGGLSGLSMAAAGLVAVLSVVLLVVLLAVGMAVQFVAPAAVVAGTGAIDSLKTSYRFFRQNILGVTGFSLLLAGISLAATFAVALLYGAGRLLDPAVGLAAGGLGYLAVLVLLGAVTPLYQVGYFEAVHTPEVLPADHEPPGDGGSDDRDGFVVGEVSTAGSAGDAPAGAGAQADTGSTEAGDSPDTHGFDTEPAGEGDDETEGDSAGGGWGDEESR